MAVTPHPKFDVLKEALHRCLPLARRWSGIVYRSTSVKYAKSADLLSGTGSQKSGGRWNPKESFKTVYSSTMPDTAMDETFANHATSEYQSRMPSPGCSWQSEQN